MAEKAKIKTVRLGLRHRHGQGRFFSEVTGVDFTAERVTDPNGSYVVIDCPGCNGQPIGVKIYSPDQFVGTRFKMVGIGAVLSAVTWSGASNYLLGVIAFAASVFTLWAIWWPGAETNREGHYVTRGFF